MPRLIDADKLIASLKPEESVWVGLVLAEQVVNAPTVDAIPIEWLERKTEEMMIVWKTADRLEDSWKAGDIMDAIELITDLWEKENARE